MVSNAAQRSRRIEARNMLLATGSDEMIMIHEQQEEQFL
jgi:hypothetical protein